MSEHAWVVENLASYVADGLDSEERELLEEHVAGCAECARALDEVRSVDRELGKLFEAVWPNPALEDRSIRALRQAAARRHGFRLSRWGKIGLVAAAAVLLGAVGSVVSALDQQKSLSLWLEPTRRGGKSVVMAKDFTSTDGTVHDPLLSLDVNPSLGAGLDINYSVERLADVSVPGLVNRDAPVGIVRERTKGSTSQIHSFKPSDVFARQGKASEGKDADTKPGTESVNGRQSVKAKLSGGISPYLGFQRGPGADQAQKLGEDKEPAKTAPAPEPAGRKIIRSGEIEFEVDSFDAAVAVITRLVAATKSGFIATVNSDKLPNGKVRGSVVVRVPPDKLDGLVLDLRKDLGKMGELKGQRIGSKDITKEYTDLESRLRAARTMEERLLKIIKDGKGQIKDLLLAEKELGNWRTKVEELEGELRYHANMVALSTLTIALTEKEIRQAASVTENERVEAGIEVDDVEKAFRAALDAIVEAKGRVTRSDLKQQAAGQFNAVLQFEVEPDAAGVIRDRLRQLGTMVRLDIDRVQKAEGGTLTLRDGKVKRGPTQFLVSLYNLANVDPRETVTLNVAAADVAAAYRKLRAAVERAKGRVCNDQLDEQDRQNVTAQLDFDVRRAEEGAVQAVLAEAGEALSRQVSRLPAAENVTDAKVLFKVKLVNAESVPARETTTLGVEVSDVEKAQALITAQVAEVRGRTVQAQRGQERNGRVTARLIYDVPLAAAAGVVEKIKAAGRLRVQDVTKNAQAPEGKLALARLDVALSNGELLVPGDAGLWTHVRNGLSLSLRGLSLSATLIIVGVLFVLPWALVIYVVVWLVRRLWRSNPPLTPAPAVPTGGDGPTAA